MRHFFVAVCVVMAVGLFLVTMIGFVAGYDPRIIACAIVAVLLVFAAIRLSNKQMDIDEKRRQFAGTFGFGVPNDMSTKVFSQSLVNAKLASLASDFEFWAEKEVEAQEQGAREPREVGLFQRARAEVERAKSAFWAAHGAAKAAGFVVKKSFKDYLATK